MGKSRFHYWQLVDSASYRPQRDPRTRDRVAFQEPGPPVNKVAKFKDQCKDCGHSIVAGDLITWRLRGGVSHRACERRRQERSTATA